MRPTRPFLIVLILAVTALTSANTASADNLISESRHALQQLVAQNPAAAKANSKAAAILVFPDVVKAGLIFLWLASWSPEVWLRSFPDEPTGGELGEQHSWVGDRQRTQRGHRGQRHGSQLHHRHAP